MKYRTALFLLQKISYLLAAMPRHSILRLGRILGFVWFHVLRIRRSVVLANLRRVFPQNRAAHRQIALGFFRKFCVSILEFLACDTQTCGNLPLQVSGMSHLRRALKKRRGVIVVTAHMGNFDLLACHQAISGLPLAIVSRKLHSRALNDFWMKKRSGCGLKIFGEGSPAIGVFRWLKQGNVLGLVVDQRLSESKGGVRVPFFGYEVWTSAAAAELAHRTGAAMVPAMIHRTSEGGNELIIEPEIQVASRSVSLNAGELMKEIHRILEKWIVAYPDEWMWLHRRFKNSVEYSTQNDQSMASENKVS